MPSYKLTAAVHERDEARTLAGALAELLQPAPDAVTLFESGHDWVVEGYYAHRSDIDCLARELAAALPFLPPRIDVTLVPDENWVAVSQAALPPVAAGRFTVHGSHDRPNVARGPFRLVIDAGEAFGTAHHATTQGCLVAIDRLTRRRRFGHVLDIGCGSGVLAIAAARLLPHAAIEAVDNDVLAVAVATANVRDNGLSRRIAAQTADGVPRCARHAAYDLILANILADPLIELAPALARVLARRGIAVLSGLLTWQAARVIAAYHSLGFDLLHHHRQAGWSTLTLIRRRAINRGCRCSAKPAV